MMDEKEKALQRALYNLRMAMLKMTYWVSFFETLSTELGDVPPTTTEDLPPMSYDDRRFLASMRIKV